MAARPRIFSVVKDVNKVNINDAGSGKQYLSISLSDIDSKSHDAVLMYGLVQTLLDAGATNAGMEDRVAKMKVRADAIRKGTYQLGERIGSGLIMAKTFHAARSCGLFKAMDDAAAKEAWKKLTDGMRAKVAGRADVVAELAKTEPTAQEELDSLFE